MEKTSKMIKLQKSDKVVLIRKPESFQELQEQCKLKFNIRDHTEIYLVFYEDDDEISIESDQDLLNAYMYVQSYLKIHVKKPKSSFSLASPIEMSHISMYSDFLQSELPKYTDELSEIIEKDEIPCKECFDDRQNANGSFDLDDDYTCVLCNNRGSVAMSKSWKIISLLIDYKIKHYLLDPLKTFQGQPTNELLTNKSMSVSTNKTIPGRKSGLSVKEDSRMSDVCQSFLSKTNCKITPLFRNNVN